MKRRNDVTPEQMREVDDMLRARPMGFADPKRLQNEYKCAVRRCSRGWQRVVRVTPAGFREAKILDVCTAHAWLDGRAVNLRQWVTLFGARP